MERPQWRYVAPGKIRAGKLQSYLLSKDIDADVTVESQSDGQYVVTVFTGSDPTDALRGYHEPERGQKRKDLQAQLQSANSIANVKQIIAALLDSARFDDD